MPIYAYRCAACGHAQDMLQKISDPVLTVCPACGAPAFEKQVTAAGFQLKGSGWYVTDFRGGSAVKSEPKAGADEGGGNAGDKAAGPAEAPAAGKPAAAPAAASPAPAADSKPAAAAPAPTPRSGS